MIHPNNKQRTKMFKYANGCRYAYNWALEQEKEAYDCGKKFISAFDLHTIFSTYKKLNENKWLQECNAEAMNTAIREAVIAYQRFFKKLSGFPNFKSKKKRKPNHHFINRLIKSKLQKLMFQYKAWLAQFVEVD